MNLPIFELERVQSLYENTVDYNLTESGFHPYALADLLEAHQIQALLEQSLGYGQTNGSMALREAIAATYHNLGPDQVLATNGSSEANFVACHSLLRPGDELCYMVPNYLQIQGIAAEMGVLVKPFALQAKRGWAPDLAQLSDSLSPRTRVIALCNPNNPTGYTLTESEMDEIVRLAESVGAWIYADEIYRGAELDEQERPSFIGRYDKVVVCGGLSKAYALPGLRLGWLAGPKDLIADSWSYHDYTSITAGILSHLVGTWALAPGKRSEIFRRNRSLLQQNLALLSSWIDTQAEPFQWLPPQAGGMAFLRYALPMDSAGISNFLREKYSVFVVAGDCFGMDGYIRLGIGAAPEYLQAGLDRLAEGWQALQSGI